MTVVLAPFVVSVVGLFYYGRVRPRTSILSLALQEEMSTDGPTCKFSFCSDLNHRSTPEEATSCDNFWRHFMIYLTHVKDWRD